MFSPDKYICISGKLYIFFLYLVNLKFTVLTNNSNFFEKKKNLFINIHTIHIPYIFTIHRQINLICKSTNENKKSAKT